MIIIVDNVPAHLLLLKADGTEQSTEEARATSYKWLGFAKGIATKCLRESKRRQVWVSETMKLPSLGSDEGADGTIRFLMVKAHAPTRYCLIIIRDSEASPHGIIVTPCSPLSPQGFGYPYTGDGVPDWGTPGFDGASNLNLTGYEGPSGGTAWQALMTDGITIKHPELDPHLVYGPDWGKIVGIGRSAGTTFSDVRYGGAIAAVGPLASTLTKASVFSVKGSRGGWMIQGEAVGHIADIDTNRQAGQLQPTFGSVPGVGSLITYSTVEPSKVYKNGKPISLSLHDESAPVTSGGAPIIFADERFIGAGVKVVGGSKRLLAIAALPDLYGVFTGSCGLFYADAPYKRVRFAQEFHVECNVGGVHQVPYFIFNESGTRASAVVYRQWSRKGVAEDGSELVSQTVETDVVHVDIEEDGTACTTAVEESEGCPYQKETADESYTSSTNQHGGPSSYSTSTTTVAIGPYHPTVAIGYDGDVEKRLELTYSESGSYVSSDNDLRTFSVLNCTVDGHYLADNQWLLVDATNTYTASAQVTATFSIGGSTVASIGYTKESTYNEAGSRYNLTRRWNFVNQPLSTASGSPASFLTALKARMRALNPAGWDSGGWDMDMEDHPIVGGELGRVTYFTVNGNKYDPGTGYQYEWAGWVTFNIYLFTYSQVAATPVANDRILRDKYFILLAADLINDKIYYATLEVTDDNGTASTTFSIRCNGDVLYSE
jgi:hypothetical protein